MTAGRATSLHHLMDAAYDAKKIREANESPGHVPTIDVNPRHGTEPRGGKNLGKGAAPVRLRDAGERPLPNPFRGRADQRPPRDGFGARQVRIHGHAKVFGHLIFGPPALTAGRLMRPAVPS